MTDRPDDRRDNFYRRAFDGMPGLDRDRPPPWRAPGARAGRMPHSIESNRPFRAGNAALLAASAQRQGYRDERWGSAAQIREAGGRLPDDARGVDIVHWQPSEPARPGGEPALRAVRYTVFNAEQAAWDRGPARWALDGPAAAPPPRQAADPPHWRVERLVRNVQPLPTRPPPRPAAEPATPRLDRAADRVQLPPREQFRGSAAEYNAHALVALAARMEAPGRAGAVPPGSADPGLDRDRRCLAAWMMAARLGVPYATPPRPPTQPHAASSTRELYALARDAQQICDYTLREGRFRGQSADRHMERIEHPDSERDLVSMEATRQSAIQQRLEREAPQPTLVEQARAAMARDRGAPSRSR